MFQFISDEVRRVRFQGSFERRPCLHVKDMLSTRSAPPMECPQCMRAGAPWVHLRMCLACGSVGCCDTSSGRHAAGHFDETQHAVMRSIEPGESWAWCYVDRAYISSAGSATAQ